MKRIRIFIVFSMVSFLALLNSERGYSQDSTRSIKRHDFIRFMDHPKALEKGNYVVVSTTLTEEDAKKMIKEYKKLKCPEPKYGYVPQKSLWYLGFEAGSQLEQSIAKRDELRKNKMFKDAWLLTIHE